MKTPSLAIVAVCALSIAGVASPSLAATTHNLQSGANNSNSNDSAGMANMKQMHMKKSMMKKKMMKSM